jgi:hypothetical protein
MHKLAAYGIRSVGAAAVAGAALLGGCVELPTAPTVAAMPSPYKPFEVFQYEDQACRSFAYQSVGGQPPAGAVAASGVPPPPPADGYYYNSHYYLQFRYNVAYEQCMYSKGNQLPGYAPPASVQAPPPASPPPRPRPPAT